METLPVIQSPKWVVNLDYFQKSHITLIHLLWGTSPVSGPLEAACLVLKRRDNWSLKTWEHTKPDLSLKDGWKHRPTANQWKCGQREVFTEPSPEGRQSWKAAVSGGWLAFFNCFACLAVLLNSGLFQFRSPIVSCHPRAQVAAYLVLSYLKSSSALEINNRITKLDLI